MPSTPPRQLLIIDGDSFAHRAYHGLPKSIRRAGNKGGGAIVGFANYLLRLYEAEKPRAVVVGWDTLETATPSAFTITTAIDVLGSGDPWAEHMPPPQSIPPELAAEGHAIPVARVQAMHEGKRRARKRPPSRELLNQISAKPRRDVHSVKNEG